MADNRVAYGFRWALAANGGKPMPTPMEFPVITSQAFNINGGAQGVSLRPGDPVRLLSTGGVTLCDGSEGAGGSLAPFGIVVGIAPYYDVVKGVMVRGNALPSAVAWGTNLANQSKVYVVPIEAGIWEIDVDEATSVTTEALYQACVGENCDYTLTGVSGATAASPKLDISTHATTSTLTMNIMGVSKTLDNQDFTGLNVKLYVRANVIQLKTVGLLGV